MDEEQIRKLINEAMTSGLKGALGEFKAHFAEQLKPISERLSEFEVAASTEVPEATGNEATKSPETAALMERLAKMEALEQSRQAELRQMKFDSTLSNTLGKHNPMHGEVVKELLANRYGAKAIEKDGEWYLPNGSKLSEEVDGFFASDAGQHFITNPSGQALGTASAKAPTVPAKSLKDVSSDDMLKDWKL